MTSSPWLMEPAAQCKIDPGHFEVQDLDLAPLQARAAKARCAVLCTSPPQMALPAASVTDRRDRARVWSLVLRQAEGAGREVDCGSWCLYLRQCPGRIGDRLYKAELVRNLGPWNGPDDLELETMIWVHWWNHRRLINRFTPIEREEQYYRQPQLLAHT